MTAILHPGVKETGMSEGKKRLGGEREAKEKKKILEIGKVSLTFN